MRSLPFQPLLPVGYKDISIPEIFMIFYTFVALYIAGNMLIKKGDEI